MSFQHLRKKRQKLRHILRYWIDLKRKDLSLRDKHTTSLTKKEFVNNVVINLLEK